MVKARLGQNGPRMGAHCATLRAHAVYRRVAQVKLSISEAARRAGVDRATIQRKVREGKLSKENDESGRPLIELSELARVYPAALAGAQGPRSDAQQLRAVDESSDFSRLEIELAVLQERVRSLERERDQFVEREARLLALAEASQRLLADQSPTSATRPGFLGRLFGR